LFDPIDRLLRCEWNNGVFGWNREPGQGVS
jgi:hypothetical protein